MQFNPIEHRICFANPERKAPSAWIEHVPFAMLLIDLIRPHTLVELGTYLGTSYCAFCQAVQELDIDCLCYAVDTWQGDEHGGFYGPGILADLREHHDARYSSFSQLVPTQFDDALPMFTAGSVDLLHIDGYHTYDAVRHDFEAWLPKMSRSGVVILHDIAERGGDFGVWRLWDELKERYPQHVELLHGHGLGVVAVGEVVPEGFRQLVDVPLAHWPALRELFRELGSRIEVRQEANSLREQLANAERRSEERAAAQQHETEQLRAEQAKQNERDLDEQIKKHERLFAEQTKQQVREFAEQQVREFAEQAKQNDLQRSALTREYEAKLSVMRSRIAESGASLSSALWQLKWLESSRGVRLVKLARASRAVLKHKGPLSLAKHVMLWTFGKRGYHLRDIGEGSVGQQAPALIQAPPVAGPSMVAVREQRLPTPGSIFTGASIVIPVFNALDDAKNCVDSVYRVGASLPFEVIVIDNGSRPDVLEWLRSENERRAHFWYISLEANLGFSKAINLGIEHTRGDYVVLQNSDTVVTIDWLDHLIAAFESDPELGIVSPMTNYVGNGPQIAEDARLLPVDQAERYAASIADRDEVQYIADRLVFFCVVVPRRVLGVLGGLSGAYGLGNFEDDDYCVRAITSGFKLGIARNAFVYHLGTRTFRANNIDHDGILDENRAIFVSRTSRLSTSPLPALWRMRIKDETAVSVVVRTKDRLDTLPVALVSLANQSFDRFEVVVVNDGGADVSAVLKRFESRFPIQYICHEQPRGAAAALNTGLNAARGEWVAYLDDDDIVYPYHLNALWSKLMETGARFAYADHTRALVKVGVGGVPTPVRWRPIPTWEYSLTDLYVQDHLPIHTWLHSRVDALELGGFRNDLDVHEDWDLLLRLAQKYPFVPTRQVSAEYRFYVDSLSNSIIQRRARSLELLEVMYDRYQLPESPETIAGSRDLIRQIIRQQIIDIDEIQGMAERGKISRTAARQRTVALVTGMPVE